MFVFLIIFVFTFSMSSIIFGYSFFLMPLLYFAQANIIVLLLPDNR
jgi:hypothetical protein